MPRLKCLFALVSKYQIATLEIYHPPPAPFIPPIVAGNYLCDQGAALSYMTAQGGGSVARG
jgi:hypothetical protein